MIVFCVLLMLWGIDFSFTEAVALIAGCFD